MKFRVEQLSRTGDVYLREVGGDNSLRFPAASVPDVKFHVGQEFLFGFEAEVEAEVIESPVPEGEGGFKKISI